MSETLKEYRYRCFFDTDELSAVSVCGTMGRSERFGLTLDLCLAVSDGNSISHNTLMVYTDEDLEKFQRTLLAMTEAIDTVRSALNDYLAVSDMDGDK